MRFARSAIRVLALSFALACAAASAGDGGKPQPEARAEAELRSPLELPRAILDALRANDAEALAEAVHGQPSDRIAKEWEENRAREAKSEHSRSHGYEDFVRVWSQLKTDEGTAQLAAEWQPVLAEQARTQVIALNIGFAAMMSALASDADLRPEEVQQLSQLVVAVQGWANGTDFNDRARLDRALAAVSGFVRRSGLETPEELVLLPYEEALALGDDAIATVKRVLLAYDIDVDATLASVQLDELERDGDRAIVRSRATVLGVPLEIVREMRYRSDIGDGMWMERRQLERIDEAMAEMEVREAHGEGVEQHGADSATCSPSPDDDESAKQWAAPSNAESQD